MWRLYSGQILVTLYKKNKIKKFKTNIRNILNSVA